MPVNNNGNSGSSGPHEVPKRSIIGTTTTLTLAGLFIFKRREN